MTNVGCDIDGVLAAGFVPPEADYVVISGRKTDEWASTIRLLGSSRPIYLRPPWFPGDSQHWKAHIIQSCKITKFYEDRPEQATEIKRCCPECRVFLVKDKVIVQEILLS